MSVTKRILRAPQDHVWSILADGWTYPLWVVGASRIREVEDSWPAVGSKLHHSVGVWPVLIDDHTSVLEVEPLRRILLRARGWPLGEASVDISLVPSGRQTEVTIEEHPSAGPGVFIPDAVNDVGLHWRNTETLRRLAYLAENRPAELSHTTPN
jgi:uncharacterized protein YndB with AHSA1/START domain